MSFLFNWKFLEELNDSGDFMPETLKSLEKKIRNDLSVWRNRGIEDKDEIPSFGIFDLYPPDEIFYSDIPLDENIKWNILSNGKKVGEIREL